MCYFAEVISEGVAKLFAQYCGVKCEKDWVNGYGILTRVNSKCCWMMFSFVNLIPHISYM